MYFGTAYGATDYAPMRISTCTPNPNVEKIDLTRAGRLRSITATKINSTA